MARRARRTKGKGGADISRTFLEVLHRVERGSNVMMFAVLASEQRLIKRLETPAEKVVSRIQAIRIFLRMNSDRAEGDHDDLASVHHDAKLLVADCRFDTLAALEARVAAIESRLGVTST